MPNKIKRRRSTLPRAEARKHFVEEGELAVLEQIRKDAVRLDKRLIAIGPFARLDAGAVAAREQKTRGAVTNLFGSQASFQAETMALALMASHWLDEIVYPALTEYQTAEEWVDAFFVGQSARGPQYGSEPSINYAFVWILWLSAVPYGLWSESISRPSLEEHVVWVKQLEGVFEGALHHYGMRMRQGTTIADLASAAAALIEGVWLNQCLTTRHPLDRSHSIDAVLRRSGLMLWRGATEAADQR
jgi:hypothetical protein